jgi:hypothetical protein
MTATVNKRLSLTPEVFARLAEMPNASAYVDNLVRADLGMPPRPDVSERPNLRKVTRQEVLDALAVHGSEEAAAEALGVTVGTVRRHVKAGEGR